MALKRRETIDDDELFSMIRQYQGKVGETSTAIREVIAEVRAIGPELKAETFEKICVALESICDTFDKTARCQFIRTIQ